MSSSKKRKTRREEEAEAKEYRDFIFSIESSAKKILKDATRRKQRKSTNNNASSPSYRKRRNPASPSSPNLSLSQSESSLLMIPPLVSPQHNSSQKRINPQVDIESETHSAPIGKEDREEATKLPRLEKETEKREVGTFAAKIVDRVKRKLAQSSPLAWTPESVQKKHESSENNKRAIERSAKRERDAESRLERKPTQVKVLSHADHKPIKIKGHFAPGSIPLRPEHTVPRRLALSEWLNPDKQTSLERGLSSHALKTLRQDNELQGPSNWVSVDLRLKYRDEKNRMNAWQASMEREKEAERLRVEQKVFLSVVTVSCHPIQTDFWDLLEAENHQSMKKARARTRLKTFSSDLPVIWTVNRDSNALQTQTESSHYPPPFMGVHGLKDRRDPMAHESTDCQVQSVSRERALQGALHNQNIPEWSQEDESMSEFVAQKLQRIKTSLALGIENNGSIFLSRAVEKRRKLWTQDTTPDVRFAAFINQRNDTVQVQSQETDEQNQRSRTSESETAPRLALILSVFNDHEKEAHTILAYSTSDSFEYSMDMPWDEWDALMSRSRDHFVGVYENQCRLLEEKQAAQARDLGDFVETQQELDRATWWHVVSVAARTAHFGERESNVDKYAELAGMEPDQARSCVQQVDLMNQLSELSARLSSVVYRQAVKVYHFEDKERTGVFTNCLALASVAAVREDDPSTTCIVIHLKRVSDLASFAIAFSVAGLRRWMLESGASQETDLPPTTISWWLLSSEWKSQLFHELFQRLCFECEGQVLYLPGLPFAQAAVRFEASRLAAQQAENAFKREQEQQVEKTFLPEWEEPSMEALVRHALITPSSSGGLGVVDCLWKARKKELREEKLRADRIVDAASHVDEAVSHSCLALEVCGRRLTELRLDPPSLSLYGSLGLVPGLFFRDPALSSTNSVLCNLLFAFDSPLLCPVVHAFQTHSEKPEKLAEYLDLAKHSIAVSPPFVLRVVISKLDFRESSTIMILNGSETETDFNLADGAKKKRNTGQGPEKIDPTGGHRRFDPEMNSEQFRLWVRANVEDLCRPDGGLNGLVYGITRSAASLNAPDTWPHRYTWHSDELTFDLLSRKRIAKDFSYISRRQATCGSNDPNGYQSILRVEEFMMLVRISRTQLVRRQLDLEERMERETEDAKLQAKVLAAREQSSQAQEQRIQLQQELNEKRLKRDQQLRGKNASVDSNGSRKEDWVRRRQDPSTRKLGRWTKWQAYLFLDNEAKNIVMSAARQAEMDQLARIAAGERPKPQKKLLEEAFNLAVKEGTLFYHHEVDDIYQWDQPQGWQGVATVPVEDESDTVGSKKEGVQAEQHAKTREDQMLKHLLRGDEQGLTEDRIHLDSDYEAENVGAKDEKELLEMRKKDAASALQAAKEVEHARRMRFIEENARRWLDSKAACLDGIGPVDLREIFREIEDSTASLVSYEQFKLALANMGLELPLEDQATLIRHLDPQKDELIDYTEFIHWLIYTNPDSRPIWIEKCFNTPPLGPNTWLKMKETDKLIRTVALHEEYKDGKTGQHYFFDMQTSVFSWIMPDVVANKLQQERDAVELRQAQAAASLAARAAAESAEQAERASKRSISRIVEHLSTSSDFIHMVAESLGLKELLERKVVPPSREGSDGKKRRKSSSASKSKVPHLHLPGHQGNEHEKERAMDWVSDSEESSVLDSDEEDEEVEEGEGPSPVKQDQSGYDVEQVFKKPGSDWRIIKPGILPEGFITRATKPITRGADMRVYDNNLNRPSLVGVVDPADVSHIPFEDFPEVTTVFIANVLEDAVRSGGQSKDQILDKSEEEEMLEMIQDIFLAAKNGNYDKVEELLDLGVKVSETDEHGNTLLLVAAQQGNKRLCKLLLRRGADINAQNLKGNTVLHFCFTYGFESLAEYLISKGADESIQNADGLTCFEGISMEQATNAGLL